MSVTKKQRQQVYDKSGGCCWYCGCNLPDRWHVDHVVPVVRGYNGEMTDPENRHVMDNFVPSCPPCNIFKSASSLEGFRVRVEGLTELMRRNYPNFKAAERFGMIEDLREPMLFWFEKEINK